MVRFEGAAGSAAKLQTPHYIRQYGTAGADTNQDYARFTGAGLFLADGVGTTEGAQIAALLAVQAASHRATALRINQMGAEEAESAVRENVLPYADEMIARYRMEKKVERAATTLGALVIARNAVVAIAIGDTRVYGIRPGGPTSMVRLGVDQYTCR
jgi:serine/threonine protein phosphatase PrpC